MPEIGLPQQKQEQRNNEDRYTDHKMKSSNAHPNDFVRLHDHKTYDEKNVCGSEKRKKIQVKRRPRNMRVNSAYCAQGILVSPQRELSRMIWTVKIRFNHDL